MFKRFFSKKVPQTLQTYLEEKVGTYQLTLADLADSSKRSLIESYCLSKCKVVNLPDDSGVAIVLGKYMTWVDMRDKALSPHLMLQGYWEMWVTSALARLTKPGTVAIDIGANLGYYTLLLADAVGSKGQVLAFEPNPRLANMARASANINGFGNRVTVREEAVSHVAGRNLTFAIPRANPQNALVMQSDAQKQGFKNVHGDYAQFIQVKSITLDSLNLTNVGMIKIDAEGAEFDIWPGMQATIDNNPEIQICMEFNAGRSYAWEPFFNEMLSKFKQVSHVDFDGHIKLLTVDMIKNERQSEDWMIYLTRV